MKWSTWKKELRKNGKQREKYKWHRWFAWYPVTLSYEDGRSAYIRAWLCWVETSFCYDEHTSNRHSWWKYREHK